MADSIIVFDGVCVLCSHWLDFVLGSKAGRVTRMPMPSWIARHRYRLCGRRAACRVPTADIADRVLQ